MNVNVSVNVNESFHEGWQEQTSGMEEVGMAAEQQLEYEKLEVYQVAIQFFALSALRIVSMLTKLCRS